MKSPLLLLPLLSATLLIGCNGPTTTATVNDIETPKPVAPVETATAPEVKVPAKPSSRRTVISTKAELDKALKADNPDYQNNSKVAEASGRLMAIDLSLTGVKDISCLAGMTLMGVDLRECPVDDITPLAGMPINALYLEKTKITDIRGLKGMPLNELYLSHTAVSDISALAGMPLIKLNLVGSRVSDISVLRGMSKLKMLWLSECPVADISPLVGNSMESLTLHRTNVSDLTPLKGCSIKRLHIGETPVKDVTPILNLPLTRLIFTPDSIMTGINELKTMTSIQQLGTYFDDKGQGAMPAAVFWKQQAAKAK